MRRRLVRPGVVAVALVAIAWLVAVAFGDSAFEQNDAANQRFAQGDFSAALSGYRELLRRRPELAEVVVNAANALHQMEEHARALAEYERALAARDPPLRAVALYDRGNTLFRLGRLEEARVSYVDALRLAPEMRDAKYNIEVIDQQLAFARRQRQQQRPPQGDGQPPPGGASPGPQLPGGGQPPQGQQPPQAGPQQPGGPQQPAPPDASGRPGTPPLNEALGDFRRDLSLEEALRVLDALRGEQRGSRALLEGDPRRGAPGSDPRY